MSRETIFLTETIFIVTWVLTSAFFWLQNFFFQTMSTYKLLEPQYNPVQGFLKNYGLKMHGFQETGDVFSFLRDFFCFQKYFSLYIGEIAI